MLKVIIREKVELIQKVANVNAAEGVHLGERQNAWEACYHQLFCLSTGLYNSQELLSRFVWSEPTDIYYFIVLIQITNWHWHVIVCRYNLHRMSVRNNI